MAGVNGTPIENTTATESPSNYEICQRTGFQMRRGQLVREWTGELVRPLSWEERHKQELQRAKEREHAHQPANPEPDDVFVEDIGGVSASDL